eukprot:COSAG01_NODE_2420_length_7729_cov_109.231717_6_plen_94_part_00
MVRSTLHYSVIPGCHTNYRACVARAVAVGVEHAQIEEARDGDNARTDLVALIQQASERAAAMAAPDVDLKTKEKEELSNLSMKDLRGAIITTT